MYNNCFNYYPYQNCNPYNKKKGVFIAIALGIIFLLIFDSPLHESLVCCSDEFLGDEDDCDCK